MIFLNFRILKALKDCSLIIKHAAMLCNLALRLPIQTIQVEVTVCGEMSRLVEVCACIALFYFSHDKAVFLFFNYKRQLILFPYTAN